MILHTLSSGAHSNAFRDCLRIATANDAILLMGNSVYIALDGTKPCSDLLTVKAAIYLLEADASAAGILARITSSATVVDFDGFVELTERFPRQLAWY